MKTPSSILPGASFRNVLFSIHQELPQGVHPYPTLKGKKRFDLLQTFNLVLAVYIALHQLIVPLAVHFLQSDPQGNGPELGFWYLYHFAIAGFLWEPFRNRHTAFWIVYLGWFAVGYLPLAVLGALVEQGAVRVQWKSISGLLCYGGSLVFTLFLLYRMRMPTTAYLFKLSNRIIPRWRYAVPYAALGMLLGLHFLVAAGRKPAAEPAPPAKAAPHAPKRSIYE